MSQAEAGVVQAEAPGYRIYSPGGVAWATVFGAPVAGIVVASVLVSGCARGLVRQQQIVKGPVVVTPKEGSQNGPAIKLNDPKNETPVLEAHIRDVIARLTSAEDFRSATIVEVANGLRRLGKERALAILSDDLHSGRDFFATQFRVALLCRLVFKAPEGGWAAPLLGAPSPEVNEFFQMQFPLFPWAISSGVPFLLIRGYDLDGNTLEGTFTLRKCANLELLTADFPSHGYNEAAEALIRSPGFRALYKYPIEEVIMEQNIRKAAAPRE